MSKKEQVVIVPTDKASCIHRNKVKTDSGYEYRLTYHETPSKCKNDGLLSGNQHLYITTDEDFMSGEWVLFSDVVMIAKSFDDRVVYDGEGNSFMKYDCKKIIATTDPKLRSDSLIEDPARLEDNLLIRKGIPQIPQSLIESYCKGGVEVWIQSQHETGEVNHVCGLQGFDDYLGDKCPKCEDEQQDS